MPGKQWPCSEHLPTVVTATAISYHTHSHVGFAYHTDYKTEQNTLQYENGFSAWDQEPLQTSISFPAKELRKSKRTGQIYTPSFLVSSLIPSWYVVRDSLIRRYFKSSQWIFIPRTCLTAFYACLNFFCTHGIMSGTAQLRTWYLFQTCHPVVYMWCFLGPVLWEGLNHNSVFTSPLHDFRHSLHLLLSYQRPTAYFTSIWRSCSTCLTTSLPSPLLSSGLMVLENSDIPSEW